MIAVPYLAAIVAIGASLLWFGLRNETVVVGVNGDGEVVFAARYRFVIVLLWGILGAVFAGLLVRISLFPAFPALNIKWAVNLVGSIALGVALKQTNGTGVFGKREITRRFSATFVTGTIVGAYIAFNCG